MSLPIRQTFPLIFAALLSGLMLQACQAFDQPPQGVLTPQELIFTSAAETLGANLTPAHTNALPMETHMGASDALDVATPTSGPTPVLILDFEDDFQEQGYWETSNQEDNRAYYATEGFRIENYAGDVIFSSTVWLDYGDVRVETSAIQAAGPESALFGVVCRWQDEDNFYAFLIDRSTGFAITRTQNGETTFLEQGSLESIPLPQGQTRRIAGGCLGHRLILELEGQVIAEAMDDTFPVGLVGLAVGTRGEAGAEVHFESFRAFTPVLELAPAPTGTPQPGLSPSPTSTVLAHPTASLHTATPTPMVAGMPSPTMAVQTTAAIATSTPTSPLPSATPLSNLVYADDFSTRSGWHTEVQPGFELGYQGGGYRIHNRNPQSNVSSMRTFEYRDIHVEVDATLVSGPSGGYYGVTCRGQNINNLYAFVIRSDGYHAIVKIQNQEVTFLVEGTAENGPIETGGGVNRIRGICQDSLLALEVNGQRLLETEDFTFRTGDPGLLVGNQNQPGSLVHFDNFALYVPE